MTALSVRLFQPDMDDEPDPKNTRICNPGVLWPKASWTLRQLYKALVEPKLDAEQRGTRELFEGALNHWEARTSNPGVGLIAEGDASTFRRSMREDSKRVYSRETIRKQWRYLSHLMRIARKKGLLDEVPALERLPPVRKRIRTVTSAELNALYAACGEATWPKHPQFSPVDFWQTAIVLFTLYGPRCKELLGGLPWKGKKVESDWPALGLYFDARCPLDLIEHLGLRCKYGWMVYLPNKQKWIKPDPLVLPLHKVARAHLDRIAGDRQFVLPISKANKALKAQWDRLLEAAGIAADRRFTRHDLRRTCETRYGDIGPHITGHAPRGVSDRYYRDFAGEIVKAVRTVKVPKAFAAALANPAEASRQLELF